MNMNLIIIALFIGVIAMAQAEQTEAAVLEKATFAGGCFWCMEPPYEKIAGVKRVIPGYTGGTEENATYDRVSSGTTKHIEAVEIIYDPAKVSYSELLDIFWMQINPTDEGGQFGDRGPQYLTAIFYHSDTQKAYAKRSKKEIEESGRFQKPIVTKILPAREFFTAEDYHQDYYRKNPIRYKLYRYYSGRDGYLEDKWPEEPEKASTVSKEGKYMKPSQEEIRKHLTPLQYKVTQEDGTERAFDNEYWNNMQEGIYVDIVSGEPLFSSTDKFSSGTGWPSFSRPLEEENIVEHTDKSLFFEVRTEVRSKHGDSHLGHVFPDGPLPTGLRYCVNSASLKFIPKEELEKEGYGKYMGLFEKD